jgi:hypothetical protein
MSSTPSRIPTPLFVRWQRLQHGLIPFLAFVLCGAVAWRLWQEAPRITAVGQVNTESADARAPVAGMLVDLASGRSPKLYEDVLIGQVVARVQRDTGKSVEVVAPISGQIVRIHHEPGQNVSNGQSIFTIAASRGRHITTYVRSDQRAQPEPGMRVDVRQRSDAARTYEAIVERVGPQYEPVPPAQLRDRKAEEWGLPVIILLPENADLKPGELVYIGWLPAGAQVAGSASQ